MSTKIGKAMKSVTTVLVALFIFLGSNNCYATTTNNFGGLSSFGNQDSNNRTMWTAACAGLGLAAIFGIGLLLNNDGDSTPSTTSKPTITSITPASSNIQGGTEIKITGTNLDTTKVVKFGNNIVNSSNIHITSSTEITVISPAASTASTVDIKVIANNGDEATAHNAFTYTIAPTIAKIFPGEGPKCGDIIITILGSGFVDGKTTIMLGSTEINNPVVSHHGTKLTFTLPEGHGTVDLQIITPGGTSTIHNAFTYDSKPKITKVSPDNSDLSGKIKVVISGSGFIENVTTIMFGSHVADIISINHDGTKITVLVPASSSPGSVNVKVITPGGKYTLEDAFTYNPDDPPAPVITGISSTIGSVAGATIVIITGTGFTGATAVEFGQNKAISFTVDSDTQITATSPAGSAGPVDIIITTPNGAVTSANAFVYKAAPTVTSLSKIAGALTGGTYVVITGTGFTGATAVKFGNNKAISPTVSDTQITVTSPAGAAGTVDVTVTTPYGTSATSTSDHFTYQPAPALSGYVYNSGSGILTVFGSNFSELGGNVAATLNGSSVDVSFLDDTQLNISITLNPVDSNIVVTNGDSQYASGQISYT